MASLSFLTYLLSTSHGDKVGLSNFLLFKVNCTAHALELTPSYLFSSTLHRSFYPVHSIPLIALPQQTWSSRRALSQPSSTFHASLP